MARNGSHRYCSPACRAVGSPESDQNRKYGRRHRDARARWASRVALGVVPCSRCGLTIESGAEWDLDHDETGGYRGPAHSVCNRAAGADKARAIARGARHFAPSQSTIVEPPVIPDDDPARGIFYGPPESDGKPRRWSRAWFPWRDDPVYDPRRRAPTPTAT